MLAVARPHKRPGAEPPTAGAHIDDIQREGLPLRMLAYLRTYRPGERAGSPGQAGFRDGAGTEARFRNPCGIAINLQVELVTSGALGAAGAIWVLGHNRGWGVRTPVGLCLSSGYLSYTCPRAHHN